jgi:hypothetical protein
MPLELRSFFLTVLGVEGILARFHSHISDNGPFFVGRFLYGLGLFPGLFF